MAQGEPPKMELWQKILAASIRTGADLSRFFPGLDTSEIEKVADVYPMSINPYYLNLVQYEGDPIWRQCIPDRAEMEPGLYEDPLSEESMSPVPYLVHRYPDRVLFQVTTSCAMYCRFCTRKRKVGKDQCGAVTGADHTRAIEYIAAHPEIRDVVMSGGDPLMLTDTILEDLLARLRAIPHVEMIRIGSRMPCVLPQRITRKLVNMLKKYHPLYLNTHFEHPSELTDDAAEALSRLADAGIPLGNQSVMLRGVNEKPEVFKELNRKLLANRVRPYYIYQADLVEGTGHFRCSIDDGLNVVRGLRGHTSGMAVPQFVIDAPGGGGKIPLLPEEYSCRSENGIMLQNFRGEQFYYPDRKPDEHLRLVVEGSEDGNGQQRITAGTLPGEAPAETVPAPLARAFQWKDRGRHSRRRMVNR